MSPAPTPLPDDEPLPAEAAAAAFVDAQFDLPRTEGHAIPEPSDPAVRRQVAGLQFLHALLIAVYHPDPAAKERRIGRVLAALDQPLPSETESARPARKFGRRVWSQMATAALLLVAAGVIWSLVAEPQTAFAAVEKALAAAQLPTNREYAVVSTFRAILMGTKQSTGTLYVRGARQYALRQPGIINPLDLWLGRNGPVFWVVPRFGAVVVTHDAAPDPSQSDRLPVDEPGTPYLQVTTVLQRMQQHYELTSLPAETMPDPLRGGEASPVDHVLGTRIGDNKELPRTIHLWTDPDSGVTRRLLLDWELPAPQPGLMQVEFLLRGEPDLPESFYDHAAHHGPGRVILDSAAK